MAIQLFAKTNPGWWIKSGIELFTFPGGEPHAKDDGSSRAQAQLAVVTQPTMADLWSLVAWAKVVRARDEKIWLALPYVPFARADRGEPLMAEWMVEFLGSFVSPDKIVTLDLHSEFARSHLRTHFGESHVELESSLLIGQHVNASDYVGVISPDAGAHDRAYGASVALSLDIIVVGQKHRDFATGKLSGFSLSQSTPIETPGRYLIVDDICDGGGTFIGLAEHINKSYGDAVILDLFVSHGIFSKGLWELDEYFDRVYTTNSWYQDPYAEGDLTLRDTVLPHKVIDLTPYIFGALK